MYTDALKLNLKDPLARWDRAQALVHLGRLQEAAADFDNARELDPSLPLTENQALAYHMRGVALAQAGQWEKATNDFKLAIRAGIEKLRTPQEMARLRLAAGDLAGYRGLCSKLLDKLGEKPKPAVSHPVVWTSVIGPGAFVDYTRLVELAEDAIDSEPKNATYHSTLAAVLYRDGQVELAIERLNRAIGLAGDEGQARDWLFLAMAYQRQGHPADAKKWLDKTEKAFRAPAAPKPPAPMQDDLDGWQSRLELSLLLREAQTMIHDAGRDSKKAK
jgi:tetratricopeptide (TPR) repeat protein